MPGPSTVAHRRSRANFAARMPTLPSPFRSTLRLLRERAALPLRLLSLSVSFSGVTVPVFTSATNR